jgi:AhpD family alkylhydroperoxidase
MTKRLNFFATSPQGMAILLEQENYLRAQFDELFPLNMALWELVKLRVSQINQCAYCVDMHNKDAIHLGESAERLYGLSVWEEMPFYTEVEKCALGWSELLTLGQTVSDQTYQDAVETLGEQGLTHLTLAVNAINSWNRLSKAFKPEVGSYTVS